jgi:protein-disulfide isomerase
MPAIGKSGTNKRRTRDTRRASVGTGEVGLVDETTEDVSVREEEAAKGTIQIQRSHLLGFFYGLLIPFALGSGVALGYLIWGRDGSPSATRETVAMAPAGGTQAPAPTTNPGDYRVDVSVDDDPSIGPEEAPITIVEFSDYACPYCRRFHMETFQALLDAYPDQIRFVYRDFPVVGGGETGYLAAQAANCALEQDKFWEYHDALFQGDYGHGRDAYLSLAEDLGLDVSSFETCLDEQTYAQEVQNDLQAGRELGVNGTPTFFINGIPLVGAQPMSNFTQVIDSELNQ